MKSYDFEAVAYDGEVYCNKCCPVSLDSEEVSPIFADQEWDYTPVCAECGEEHNYMTILHHHYKLIVDLDERGSFRAHVEDEDGEEIFEYVSGDELDTEAGETDLVECGYMRHLRDADGLEIYLKTTLKLISPGSTIEYRNPYRKG